MSPEDGPEQPGRRQLTGMLDPKVTMHELKSKQVATQKDLVI